MDPTGTSRLTSERRAAARTSQIERERIADLFTLVPRAGQRALDVGTWDGHLALRLADRYRRVTAVDLDPPVIDHPRVESRYGDATALDFPDGAFDLVMCTEVLEHLPPEQVPLACAELARVSGRRLVIGVPYRQDLRLGRTTCGACGRHNPPWGHRSSFTVERVEELFAGLRIEAASLVARRDKSTNALAVAVTNLAGNPYGTYDQEQPCLHCGARLLRPQLGPGRTALATLGLALRLPSVWRHGLLPGWLHVRLVKP